MDTGLYTGIFFSNTIISMAIINIPVWFYASSLLYVADIVVLVNGQGLLQPCLFLDKTAVDDFTSGNPNYIDAVIWPHSGPNGLNFQFTSSPTYRTDEKVNSKYHTKNLCLKIAFS